MNNLLSLNGEGFVLLMVKIFFVAFTMLYTLFAFMVVRQVALMNKSFAASLHGLFTFVSWVHFLVAILAVSVVFFSL